MGGILLGVVVVLSAAGCHLVFPIEPGDDAMPIADGPSVTPPPDARAQPYLFSDGFDAGITPPWTVVTEPDDAVSHTTDPVRAGTGAASCRTDTVADGQAMVHYTPPTALDTAHVRFWVRLQPGFAPSSWVGIAALARDVVGDWQNLIVVTLEADLTLYIENGAGGQYHYSARQTQLVPGTWHQIDLSTTFSPLNGSIALAIDTQPEITVPMVDTGVLPADRVAFGIIWQGVTTEALELQLDEVSIDPMPL